MRIENFLSFYLTIEERKRDCLLDIFIPAVNKSLYFSLRNYIKSFEISICFCPDKNVFSNFPNSLQKEKVFDSFIEILYKKEEK